VAVRDIILVGASAGGVEALTALVRELPADLPASVFVVLHVPPHGASALPSVLSRAGRLPASHASDREPIRQGQIYVAPPDRHLLVREGEVRLGRGPEENRHRPAVDTLFRSAALTYGPRCIGVVLSGALDDGTSGLLTVKSRGGLTMVQDPKDALYPGMPGSALAHLTADHVASAGELGALLKRLIIDPSQPALKIMDEKPEDRLEDRVAEEDMEAADALTKRSAPSVFACPDCHGVLWELGEGEPLRYRCRVGHAYLAQSLGAAQDEKLDEALWSALRALKESAALSRKLADRSRERGLSHLASEYTQRVIEADDRAGLIEGVLRRGRLSSVGETGGGSHDTRAERALDDVTQQETSSETVATKTATGGH
jgi:two-component system, chemotaxis family, protein-glutamate methylesterase/glutaminase